MMAISIERFSPLARGVEPVLCLIGRKRSTGINDDDEYMLLLLLLRYTYAYTHTVPIWRCVHRVLIVGVNRPVSRTYVP